MIDSNQARLFFRSFGEDLPPKLAELETYANETGVPIIRKETQGLLRFLLCLKKPNAVLELGSAIGFSSCFMAGYLPEGSKITTVEIRHEHHLQAKENAEKMGLSDRILFLEGDAREVTAELEGPYDMIFLDCAKGQYGNLLPELLRLLPEGGLLITDNILMDGDLVKSRYGVVRRDRTIHARMREYLYEITHHPLLETVLLEDGDGMALSMKREKANE